MHKNEPKVNLTLIIRVNKVYELRVGTIRTYKSTGSLIIQLWSWFNILLKRINWTLVSYVNNNDTLSATIYWM